MKKNVAIFPKIEAISKPENLSLNPSACLEVRTNLGTLILSKFYVVENELKIGDRLIVTVEKK